MKNPSLEFEEKWHGKIVRNVGKYEMPDKEYVVTAALYSGPSFINDDESIFAIKALDYNLENKHWFTFYIKHNELEETMKNFEIIG